MRNLHNFNEFVTEQQLNEGKFMDALKGIWKFFKDVNKTLQTNIQNFTKKLEESKTWQETLGYVNTMLIQPNTKYFNDSMKQATSVDQIRRINYEIHKSTFSELNEVYLRWDGQNQKSPLMPSVMFAGTPFANMYNFKDTPTFIKNLPNAVNALVSTYAKTTGFPLEEVTKSINSYKDLTQNPPEQKPDQGTTNTTPEKPAQGTPTDQKPDQNTGKKSNVNQNATDTSGFDSFRHMKSFGDFILEATVDNQQGNQQGNQQQDNQQGNQQQNNQQGNQQQDNQQGNQPIDKLKTENINQFTQQFYGNVQKKIKAFKPQAGTTNPNAQKDVQDVAKTMTGSKNIDSKKNLLKAISNPKLTSGQLADLRDAVAKVLKIDKPEQTIGKF